MSEYGKWYQWAPGPAGRSRVAWGGYRYGSEYPLSPRAPVFWIPVALRETPIGSLPLPPRVRYALLQAGLDWGSDLHERPVGDVLGIERIGPKAVKALEVGLESEGGRRVTLAEARELRDTEPSAPEPERADRTVESVVRVPAAYREILLEYLHWPIGPASVLKRWPLVRTLGDLADLPPALVMEEWEPARARKIRRFIGELTEIPIDGLKRVAYPSHEYDDPGPRLPRLRLPVLAGLAAARTLEEEIRALVADLPRRNARFFLARLPLGHMERPTYASLAETAGISATVVRVIFERRARDLEWSGLRLRIGTRAVEVLAESGKALGTGAFLSRLEAEGLPQRAEVIRALPALSEMLLVPAIEYRPRTDDWRAGSEEEDEFDSDAGGTDDTSRVV